MSENNQAMVCRVEKQKAAPTPRCGVRHRTRIRFLRLERRFELHHRRGFNLPRRRNASSLDY